jgi:hypothetical protein
MYFYLTNLDNQVLCKEISHERLIRVAMKVAKIREEKSKNLINIKFFVSPNSNKLLSSILEDQDAQYLEYGWFNSSQEVNQ